MSGEGRRSTILAVEADSIQEDDLCVVKPRRIDTCADITFWAPDPAL
jgi:hypothetical protein